MRLDSPVGVIKVADLYQVLPLRYVIEPYHKYPNLLDILFNFLKTEHSRDMRREVIRGLGLLGALDPYKHNQHHQRNGKRSKMGTPVSKPMDKKTQGTGRYGRWALYGRI